MALLLALRGGGSASYTLDCAPGSYAITGRAASLIVSRVLNATAGNYAVTGQAVTLAISRLLNAVPGSYSVAGQASALVVDRLLNTSIGSYSHAGSPVELKLDRLLDANAGSYEVTGFDIEFIKWPDIPPITRPAARPHADTETIARPPALQITSRIAALATQRIATETGSRPASVSRGSRSCR